MDKTYNVDERHLKEAALIAEDVLDGSPFNLLFTSTDDRYDPSYLLAGTPLRFNEIHADLAVPRRVKIEGQECEINVDELPSWLYTQTGKTVLLIAEAGEGKTTFLNLLRRALVTNSIILNWKVKSSIPFDDTKLRMFHETVRTRWSPKEVSSWKTDQPPLVVIGEIESGLGATVADEVCNSLSERASNFDLSVVLIAGRPADLNFLENRIPATIIRLSPLNNNEVEKLCRNLQRAYLELNAKGLSEKELYDRYPNLLRFLNSNLEFQSSVFLEPSKPLLASLLQAVYGEQYWKRLVDEFESLTTSELKTAYLSICLATSAGDSVPKEYLLRFLNETELDEYSQCNPWIRTEDGAYTARHRVIAQTVIEESRADTLIGKCLQLFLQGMKEDDVSLQLIWHIFDQAAQWEPIAPQRSVHFKPRIKRFVRETIQADKTFINDLPLFAKDDVRQLIQWASTFHALLPDERPTNKQLPLLEANQAILQKVKTIGLTTSLSERVQYYLDKNDYDITRAINERPENLNDLNDVKQISLRVNRWSKFLNRAWCGPDFFADLFIDAEKLIHTMYLRPETLDADETFRTFVIAAKAFENLRLQSQQDTRIEGFDVKYSILISRLMYIALPKRKIEVLAEAWKVSENTKNPNPKTGVHYAERLAEESLMEDARNVLRRVLEKHPDWGDAVMHLVMLAETDEQLLDVQKHVQNGFDASSSGLSLAILNHAAARLKKNDNEREKFLRLSIQGYSAFIKKGAVWEGHGHLWQEACKELGELTQDIPRECAVELKRWLSKNRI